MIPLVDELNGALTVVGFAEREWAHKKSICHLTSLLIPVHPDRRVEIQIRDSRKDFPGCRDFFGGHVALDKEFWPLLLGQPFSISALVMASAVREANEELRVSEPDGRGETAPHVLNSSDLRRVREVGAARWDGIGNVERSTVFVVPIKSGLRICPMDDIHGSFFRVNTQTTDWSALRDNFLANEQYAYHDRQKAAAVTYDENKARWQFADGAARILRDEMLFGAIKAKIDTLVDEDFERGWVLAKSDDESQND